MSFMVKMEGTERGVKLVIILFLLFPRTRPEGSEIQQPVPDD